MAKEDLRVIKTLESIDNSLLENLKTTPFNKITVETLCNKARINRTTFYKHYNDKYDLLDSFLKRTIKEFKEKNDVIFIEADINTLTEERYKMPFRETVDFLISRKDVYEVLWTAQIGRNIFDEMVEAVAENIMQKKYAENPEIGKNPELFFKTSLFANLFAYNHMVSVRWWIANDFVIGKEEFFTLFDDMMTQGIFKVFKEQL